MDVQLPQTSATPAVTQAPSGSKGVKTVSMPTSPVPQAADAQSQASKPSTEQVQKALEKLQQVTQPVAQNLQFSVDDSTGETVIKVVDDRTQELIRQIPSQEFLDMVKALDKLSGLLLRQKA